MNNLKLAVNSRIEVLKNKNVYKALIIDTEEDNIKINIPVYKDEDLMLSRDDTIKINSYSEEGKCYSYNCDVLSQGKDNNVIYYRLSMPYNVKNIQRRDFFRVSLLGDIEYINTTNMTEEEIAKMPYSIGSMVDLSGSGLKVKVKEDLKKGDHVLIRLKLTNTYIIVKSEIVRVEATEDNQRLCGIKFSDISPKESDLIIKELFQIARKQRANL